MSFVAAALEFLHARKWLVELILLAVLLAGLALYRVHLIDMGKQEQKDADTAAYAKLQADTDKETSRLQGVANDADKAHTAESAKLAQYIADHPLHGSLCPHGSGSGVPGTSSHNPSNGPASAGSGPVLPMPQGDRSRDQDDPDQLGMLSALAGRADQLSAGLREWQARK